MCVAKEEEGKKGGRGLIRLMGSYAKWSKDPPSSQLLLSPIMHALMKIEPDWIEGG